jgi:hypothetical protein
MNNIKFNLTHNGGAMKAVASKLLLRLCIAVLFLEGNK